MTWLIFCPTMSRDISNGDQLFLACPLAGAELDRCPTSALMCACSLLFCHWKATPALRGAVFTVCLPPAFYVQPILASDSKVFPSQAAYSWVLLF